MSYRRLAVHAALALTACDDGDARPEYHLAASPAAVSISVRGQVAVGVQWIGEALPDARVTWSATPDSVVSVAGAGDVATLTGTRVGTTTVTATATDGRRVATASVAATVRPLACIPIGPIVTPAAATLAVGGRVQFSVSLVPPPPCGSADGRVDFRTVDSTVASVDTLGWVTGRRTGTTTLIVSPRGNPGVSASASITVIPGGIIERNPVVQPTVVDVAVGDTVRLRGMQPQPPNAPPDASREVRFRSADTTVATIDAGGLLRAVRVGQTHVRVIAVADTSLWTAVPVTVRQR